MRMTSKLLVAVVLTALAFTPTAASGAAQPRGSNDHTTTTRSTPLTGTLEGVHTSRTPLTAPFVLDRFDMRGQATHLGRLTLVIESTVDFGVRPVTGVGTMTFVAADGDRLVAGQTGSSVLVAPGSVLITERAVIDPGRSTGRFAGAEGAFTVQRLADAATGVGGRTVGSFAGTISLRRPSADEARLRRPD